MNMSSMMNEINRRVAHTITKEMSVAERKTLRDNITREVIRERAKRAGADEKRIYTLWKQAIQSGHNVETIEKKFGL